MVFTTQAAMNFGIRIQYCIDCHALAKKRDYMFSEGVMDVVKTQREFQQSVDNAVS